MIISDQIKKKLTNRKNLSVCNEVLNKNKLLIKKEPKDLLTLELQVNPELMATEYSLETFHRSNQDTCLLHSPAVFEGDWVQSGDLLADCAASSGGELSLGKNILVAYMPWEGYNFEDAILISERLVFEDVYSSIHIERYDIEVRETTFGMETITNNLPLTDLLNENENLAHLDSNGVAKLGSWVEEGDVLVGRVTPIDSKKNQSTYKNLLHTILQTKPQTVRDSSLRAPKGMKAKVVNIQIYMIGAQLKPNSLSMDRLKKINKKIKLKGKTSLSEENRLTLKKGSKLSPKTKPKKETLKKAYKLSVPKTKEDLKLNQKKAYKKVKTFVKNTLDKKQLILSEFKTKNLTSSLVSISLKKANEKKEKKENQEIKVPSPSSSSSLSPSPSLSPSTSVTKKIVKKKEILKKGTLGVIKKLIKGDTTNLINIVYVYLAEKRKIQVGDKMAGRHGNKGIVSQVLPRQDMPFLANGTPIDMALNPLGVPSRMNVGQLYECLLGLAAKYLGEHYKVFPFDEIYGPEASRSFVFSKLYEARKKVGLATKGGSWLFDPNCPGKTRLFDGRTGDPFDQSVTVGYAYMLKLVHLVDDKIHARSTGPYSLITQQPLRGRSKQGGQRLGEMEVWALEGYGAAFTLLEMLTIKSDDMTGRMTLWSNLILNKEISIGTPESFKVLVCELQALCLDIGIFRTNSSGYLSSIESLTELP